jgi:hypothetical protein
MYLPPHSQTPTSLTNLAAIDALETAELVKYCKRYYPGRVYTGISGAGLGADGADQRERERESGRAQRIRDVGVAAGWVGDDFEGRDGEDEGAGVGGDVDGCR